MEFVTAAILSGLIYDIVKKGVKVTTRLVIDKTAEHQKQWPADEASTEKIVNRINELGYIEGESQAKYCQRLGNDRTLTQLLSPVNQITITQNIENLQGVGQVTGDMVNPVFNFNSQGAAPKKS
jgi:hypothetical protein